MELTKQQILSALKGAPEAYIRNGLVIPDRFRDDQRRGYLLNIPQFSRTYCHASATLDFYTDAAGVTLYYKNTWNESDWQPFFFDVYENNVLTQRLGFYQNRKDYDGVPDGQIHAVLSPGEKRVTVHLTNFFHVELARVTLENASVFRPYTHRGRFLAFGDSITEGFQSLIPSMTYVNQLSRLMDLEAVNYGIGGETVRPELIVPGSYPACDFVTVAYGTNDLPRTPEPEFQQLVQQMHSRLHEAFPHTPVFILTPIFRYADCAEHPAGHLRHYASILADSARHYDHFRVIDGLSLIPDERSLYYDKTHPNVGGFAVMAIELQKAIEKELTP